MRLLSRATCTSGEPVSVSLLRWSPISADFCSFSNALGCGQGSQTRIGALPWTIRWRCPAPPALHAKMPCPAGERGRARGRCVDVPLVGPGVRVLGDLPDLDHDDREEQGPQPAAV